MDSIVFGLRILGELSFLLFLVRGIASGIILSIKRLGGWHWILVSLAWIVIPLGLFLTFWAITILLGVLFGLRGGKHIHPRATSSQQRQRPAAAKRFVVRMSEDGQQSWNVAHNAQPQ